MTENDYIVSVVVGMWRCGAPNEEIAEELELTLESVIEIIDWYKEEIKGS